MKPDIVVTMVTPGGEEIVGVHPGTLEIFQRKRFESKSDYQKWLDNFLSNYSEVDIVELDESHMLIIYRLDTRSPEDRIVEMALDLVRYAENRRFDIDEFFTACTVISAAGIAMAPENVRKKLREAADKLAEDLARKFEEMIKGGGS